MIEKTLSVVEYIKEKEEIRKKSFACYFSVHNISLSGYEEAYQIKLRFQRYFSYD